MVVETITVQYPRPIMIHITVFFEDFQNTI